MKTGDIVSVHDGSYSLMYNGEGEMVYVCGNHLRGSRFKVLLTGVTLPADDCNDKGISNDTMLCFELAPEQILFTRAKYCRMIDRPTTGPDKMEIETMTADIERLRKELTAFQNALTPSSETKTKHIGEFETPGCCDCGMANVSWRTIKKIMAAIHQHAKDNC